MVRNDRFGATEFVAVCQRRKAREREREKRKRRGEERAEGKKRIALVHRSVERQANRGSACTSAIVVTIFDGRSLAILAGDESQ